MTRARPIVRTSTWAAVLALSAGLSAQPARAATVTMIIAPAPPDSRQDASGRFTFTAAPGERNTVTLRADGADLLVSDVTAALQAGSGCQQEAMTVRCPLAATFGGVADLGDGDDTMTVDSRFGGASVSVDGGAGDDLLTGEGSGGDDFTGGPGADMLIGGEGSDDFTDGDPDDAQSPDRYEGGGGHDLLSFAGRHRGLRLDLAAGATADGDVITGIEQAVGGEGGDVLAGTDGPDQLGGGLGDDVIVSRGGNDALDGGPGADGLDGGPGDDRIEGGSGADHLLGGAGADRLDPSLTGRETRGEDQTPARPAPPARDRVDCGDGADTVAGPDRADSVAGDCELLTGIDDGPRELFTLPLRPGRSARTSLTYELQVSVFGPHHAPLRVRLELLDGQGRLVGRSRRVTLPAGQNTRRIRVGLKRGVVVRRPAIGWRIRVRAWGLQQAGVLTLPTRP
jgi:Ca2+-binding RTX toxin-like protein